MKRIIFGVLFLIFFVSACKTNEKQVSEIVPIVVEEKSSMPEVKVDKESKEQSETIIIKEPEKKSPDNALVKVDIKGFAFIPNAVKIKSGDTVEWENFDSAPHTATLIEGPEEFDSKLLDKGEKWRKTFIIPGIYEYKCSPHPSMRGVVIVE